jgi:hypothetical protein
MQYKNFKGTFTQVKCLKQTKFNILTNNQFCVNVSLNNRVSQKFQILYQHTSTMQMLLLLFLSGVDQTLYVKDWQKLHCKKS